MRVCECECECVCSCECEQSWSTPFRHKVPESVSVSMGGRKGQGGDERKGECECDCEGVSECEREEEYEECEMKCEECSCE